MPELPEVETTRRGIAPHLVGQRVIQVIVRDGRLRWPVPEHLSAQLPGCTIKDVTRRGKYLLLHTTMGTAIMHLGMSGSLSITPAVQPPRRHQHVDIVLAEGHCLRLTDPRRFGCVLWTQDDPGRQPLLARLGPEPLTQEFSAEVLYRAGQRRHAGIKSLLLDSHVVAGVGNIYANEALFMAGIYPVRAARRIAFPRYQRLAEAVVSVLNAAIRAGGTTLRDFVGGDGRPGYFKQSLLVYARTGAPCLACGAAIRQLRQGQRSSFYCARCQR